MRLSNNSMQRTALRAAAEARAYGRGGVSVVSRMTGIARSTIERGLREIEAKLAMPPGRYGEPTDHGLVHWLLFRRSLDESHERAYSLCTAPPEAAVQDLAIAAGQRWSIECCFESAKQETGLDDYEVRSWPGWDRHVTLSIAALTLLSVVRATASRSGSKKTKRAQARGTTARHRQSVRS